MDSDVLLDPMAEHFAAVAQQIDGLGFHSKIKWR